MTASVLRILGGLGLFLLGMVVMTDGLRALAGSGMQRALARFTRTPLSGAATGFVATALIHSSAATTVTAVGFVGAGLLEFPQALGVILGANVGTTVTGWMVVLLGFELDVGTLLMPLIPVGVLLRILGRGRWRAVGFALAGLGLVFVAIATLQQGMAGTRELIGPASLPGADLAGRLALVAAGLLFTLVTQSSSAGMAASLAALDAGALSFAQAASLVIGMDVGTSFGAALAGLGGSVHARRTGFSHVIFNLLSGGFAFALLGPYMALASRLAGDLDGHGLIALVAFQTLFNALAVAAILPFAGAFARAMVRLVPERPSPFARRLDATLLGDPDAAIMALTATLRELAATTLELLVGLLRGTLRSAARIELVVLALAETRRYVERITTSSEQPVTHQRHVSAMHVIDHLERLAERCGESDRWQAVRREAGLARRARGLADAIEGGGPLAQVAEPAEPALEQAWRRLEDEREAYRRSVLEGAAAGGLSAQAALDALDAMRWLQRVAYHAWRILHHLRRAQIAATAAEPEVRQPHAEPETPG